jgi:serine phosphatase RsbU (regulator of sigma subunit)/PAS domain-containing protein
LLACAIVGVTDAWFTEGVVVTPLVIAGPLICAIAGPPRRTLWLGLLAVALSIPLGWVNHIGGSPRHLVGIAVVVIGSFFAWRLAVARAQRERAVIAAKPALDRAARLAAVMQAGKIGEWWWDLGTGRVGWDIEAAALFGLGPTDFDGTYEAWLEHVHPDDHDHVRAAVEAGLARREAFRFDHRCVWPDGTIHWLEGIGEVTVDGDGEPTGAVGLVFNVDERYRELDERAHLVEVEQLARRRAEFVARIQGVLANSLDVTEILERVTEALVPDLADWCSVVLAIDRPRDDPLIVAAHADPRMRTWAREVQRRFPYDPEAQWGAANVIRTGEREVMSNLAAFRVPDRSEREVIEQADVDSVVTVAIVGPLGVLGALQLIRGRERHAFTDNELELIDELAGRCGAALHTAILFTRQTTSRAALDTLQRVSGGLASASTRLDVARAVIAHSTGGLRATGAAMFLMTPQGLELLGSDGLGGPHIDAIAGFARRIVGEDSLANHTTALAPGLSALVAPLRILSRTVGALAFGFAEPRTFADEEVSMLVSLAARCAGALERAGLFERERETALVLQRRLLPDIPIVPEWLEVAARYEPAAQGRIGGDWYQLVDAAPGRVLAVVGDAVGHGVPSAAAMGQLRASIATAVASTSDADATLGIVDAFAAQGMDTIGATAAFAWFDQSGWLQYGSAGHPPMLLAPADGPVRLLDEGRRPLLGFSSSVVAPAGIAEVPFRSGDLALMYTDGLVERRRETIDVGLTRLVRSVEQLRHRRPAEICDELVAHLGGVQTDDVAVLALRRR